MAEVGKMWIDVCARKPTEDVREVIELAGQYIVVPFSNTQAHRIAEKYSCNKFFVEDIEALKKLVKAMKKHVHRRFEIVEINDIQWYPRVVEYLEVLESNDLYIEFYNTEEVEGYYGRYRNVEINITDEPF